MFVDVDVEFPAVALVLPVGDFVAEAEEVPSRQGPRLKVESRKKGREKVIGVIRRWRASQWPKVSEVVYAFGF